MKAQPDYKALYEEQLKKSLTLELKVQELERQIEQLRKMIFGSKHERFVTTAPQGLLPEPSAKQLSLDLNVEQAEERQITAVEEVTYIRTKTQTVPRKPHPGRSPLPEHLRREVIILEPDRDTTGLRKIGEEITEMLDYTEPNLFVKKYIRIKYASPQDDGTADTIITASLPQRIMSKSMFGEGLLARIMVDKYCDHLPLYRQRQRFIRQGVTIAASTIDSAVSRVQDSLLALYEAHKKIVLSSSYLQADETTIRVQDEQKKGTTHRGYYWTYYDSTSKLVLFDYRKGRGREGPADVLKDFKGYLQVDGYGVYEEFENREGIKVLNCMAHARRKFVEAASNDAHRAHHALSLFQQLYDTERRIKEKHLQGEEVVALRQKESVPVLLALKKWFDEQQPKVLPKSAIGLAIAYCQSRWEKLSLYTTDSILNIDNNLIENTIRPIALGRKNYLFAGSHDAAQRAAVVYSLLATCLRHEVNPYYWLKDVLENMHSYTTANIHELLPQYWKKSDRQ